MCATDFHRRFLTRCITLVLSMLGAMFAPTAPKAAAVPLEVSEQDGEPLKVIAQAYLAHRESFEYFTCKFKVRVGTARTLDSALKGELEEETIWSADGTWIVNGLKTRYELTSDPRAYEKAYNAQMQELDSSKKANKILRFPLPSEKFLDSGKYQLKYSVTMRVAQVGDEPQRDGAGIFLTPWDMGVMGSAESGSPAQLLLKNLEKSHIGPTKNIRGVELLPVTVPLGEQEQTTLYDPNRGYLPIQISMTDQASKVVRYQLIITDVLACSKERWFPKRSVMISASPATGFQPPFTVRETIVSELNLDKRPEDSVFQIELQPKTYVNDDREMGSQFQVQEATQVGLVDLESLFKRAHGVVGSVGDRGLPPRPNIAWRWTIGLLAAVAFGLLGFWYFRKAKISAR